MSKEPTKKFVENYGFICNKCGKIIVDGGKHNNEEDLCDQCKIADLEAKLAESEESHHKNIVELTKIATEKDRKIDQLKQQLAEIQKEIEELKTITNTVVKPRRLTQKEFNDLKKQQTLTAIIELEKVKEFLVSGYAVDNEEIEKEINNQIEKLKKKAK